MLFFLGVFECKLSFCGGVSFNAVLRACSGFAAKFIFCVVACCCACACVYVCVCVVCVTLWVDSLVCV